jgi:hypothetical protein
MGQFQESSSKTAPGAAPALSVCGSPGTVMISAQSGQAARAPAFDSGVRNKRRQYGQRNSMVTRNPRCRLPIDHES